ncbi:hypothetical protein [Rickettsia endosymbiont of Polydrusus tereticollis]|uniref:hypothetical protein n=1 Tax=Rickettsia endosymbiont of Polydrusus tereticollis TaxID=3066251 RepID=UPI0031334066
MDNPALKDAIDRSLGKVEEKKEEGTEEQKLKEQIGKDGYSVEGVLYSAKKAIIELQEAGVPEENFVEITEELKKYKEDVGNKMSSKEGVTSLINDYIKDKGIVNSIGIVDENSNFIPDKGDIVKKVGTNLKLPEEVLNAGLKRIDLISPLHKGINKHMAQCFAIEGQQENPVWCVLDRAKLTPENIEKFTKLVNHDMKAFSVIQENLTSEINVEKNKEITSVLLPTITKLNPEEMQEKGKEIVKNFAPLLESKNEKLAKSTESALAKLDSGYLSEYSAVIAAELKTVNEKGTSLWEKFKSVFTHTDYLAERLKKVTDNYVLKNNEYVEKEINNKIFLNAMPEKQLATGLSEFIEQNKDKLQGLEDITSKIKTSSKKINSKELAELRKVNPVGFDKALFGQAPHYTVPENREEIQAAMVVPPPPLISPEEELAKELASVPPPPLEQSAKVAQQTQQAKQAPSYDKIPPPPPSPEVTREVAQTQKPVTPTKTPSWQQTVSNRGESQKKDGGIAP